MWVWEEITRKWDGGRVRYRNLREPKWASEQGEAMGLWPQLCGRAGEQEENTAHTAHSKVACLSQAGSSVGSLPTPAFYSLFMMQ